MTEPGETPLRVVEGGGETEPDDWEAVYRHHVGGVFAYLLARTGNRPDAEDLCTQVFMRALPHLRAGASGGEVTAYLLTTARTVAADFWRRHYRQPLAELDDELVPDRLPEAPDESQALRVERLLGRLPERYSRVLELRFLRGYSIRETAEAMGITANNCKVLQLRALRRAAQLPEETT